MTEFETTGKARRARQAALALGLTADRLSPDGTLNRLPTRSDARTAAFGVSMIVDVLDGIKDRLTRGEDAIRKEQSRKKVDAQEPQIRQSLGKTFDRSVANLW